MVSHPPTQLTPTPSNDNPDELYETLRAEFTSIFETATEDSSALESHLRPLLEGNHCETRSDALAGGLLNASRSRPESIDTFVQAIAPLTCEPTPTSIRDALILELLELLSISIKADSGYDHRDKSTETTRRLSAALLSAVCLRLNIFPGNGNPAHRFVTRNLQLGFEIKKHKAITKSKEVALVEVALILFTGGAELMKANDFSGWGIDAVIQALEEKKAAVENIEVASMLEDVVKLAQGGFSEAYTSRQAWNSARTYLLEEASV